MRFKRIEITQHLPTKFHGFYGVGFAFLTNVKTRFMRLLVASLALLPSAYADDQMCLPHPIVNDTAPIFATLSVIETSPKGMREVNRNIVRDSVPLLKDSPLHGFPRLHAYGPLITKGRWTGAPIKFEAVKRIANAGVPSEMIKVLENDFDFKVIVVSGDKSRARPASVPVPKPEKGDFSGLIKGALPPDPLVAQLIQSVRNNPELQHYQDFFESEKMAPYAGMFLAPGRNTPGETDANTRAFGDQPIMLLKDFADRETILHEFVHYQLYLDRQQKNEIDPWVETDLTQDSDFFYKLEKNPVQTLEKRIHQLNIQTARTAEELDVHKFIADFGVQLGLTQKQIDSSAAGYKDHLLGSSYAPGMKSLIDETDGLQRLISNFLNRRTNLNPAERTKIEEMARSLKKAYEENNNKFTESVAGN